MTQKEKILDLLSTHDQVDMRDLNAIAYRYGGRIDELRRDGYNIETVKIEGSHFAYRLIPVEADGQMRFA